VILLETPARREPLLESLLHLDKGVSRLAFQVRMIHAERLSCALLFTPSPFVKWQMAFSGVTGSAKEDLVVSLAILALHDGGVAVTADNINSVISASGNTVAGYWGALYSKVLAGRNIDDLLLKPGAGGAGPAPAAGSWRRGCTRGWCCRQGGEEGGEEEGACAVVLLR